MSGFEDVPMGILAGKMPVCESVRWKIRSVPAREEKRACRLLHRKL